MSQMGQSRHSGRTPTTSGLLRTADLGELRERVRVVPDSEVLAVPRHVRFTNDRVLGSCGEQVPTARQTLELMRTPVCTGNLIRVDEMTESPKLVE